jgi:RimJ/RimL family protein N-acetyltransferase
MVQTSAWLAAVRIDAERLGLLPLRVDDAEELAPLLDDITLHQFTGGVPANAHELRERYARQVIGHSADGGESWLNWIVRERDSGAVAGTVQATVHHQVGQPVADLAWVIAADFQGRGYAVEAAGAMVDWLRSQGVPIMAAYIHPEHHASMAVAGRLGLQPTADMVDGEVRWTRTSDAL